MITSTEIKTERGVLTTPPIKQLTYAVITIDDYVITLGYSPSIVNGLDGYVVEDERFLSMEFTKSPSRFLGHNIYLSNGKVYEVVTLSSSPKSLTLKGLTLDETEFSKKLIQQHDKFVAINTTKHPLLSVVIRHRNKVVDFRCFLCDQQEDVKVKTSLYGKKLYIDLITKEKEAIRVVDHLLNSKPTAVTIKA